MAQGRLDGKVAWISGGTSGIGEAAAELFAEEGGAVAIVGRRGELGQQIADRINQADGRAIGVACDVADGDQVRESIEETIAAFGRLDIVVNNAGMAVVQPLHEASEADWDRIMDVNVKSMYFATKYAMPHLVAAGRSYIVNVGSISSFVGQAMTPIYTTSKHAVLGLSRSIALDYAEAGIRCNCVCPGITDTPMLRGHGDAMGDADEIIANRLKRTAMGVALSPRDVAKSILFFSCEDSSGVTGTSLTIDCGYLTAAEWHTEGKTAFME